MTLSMIGNQSSRYYLMRLLYIEFWIDYLIILISLFHKFSLKKRFLVYKNFRIGYTWKRLMLFYNDHMRHMPKHSWCRFKIFTIKNFIEINFNGVDNPYKDNLLLAINVKKLDTHLAFVGLLHSCHIQLPNHHYLQTN